MKQSNASAVAFFKFTTVSVAPNALRLNGERKTVPGSRGLGAAGFTGLRERCACTQMPSPHGTCGLRLTEEERPADGDGDGPW